jgi:hypothetical protein
MANANIQYNISKRTVRKSLRVWHSKTEIFARLKKVKHNLRWLIKKTKGFQGKISRMRQILSLVSYKKVLMKRSKLNQI